MQDSERIFRYLKGQPKLGLWYPKDSPFILVAYTDSDYAGASLDRKSITGGCQFLRCRLISWQCKKQTIVANFITEVEYVAASNSNEKKLIQMIKIHTDKTVADLLTKAFDIAVVSFKYLKFVQVFLDKQVGDMSTHDEIFVTPSHTKKVFGNMKRVGKGFSRTVTPLFPTMMVQAQKEMGKEPIADEAVNEENVPTQSNDPPLSRVNHLEVGRTD
ncbi:hypothetical protein Tco_0610034 [Tanacetum coccineum]